MRYCHHTIIFYLSAPATTEILLATLAPAPLQLGLTVWRWWLRRIVLQPLRHCLNLFYEFVNIVTLRLGLVKRFHCHKEQGTVHICKLRI
jgi:hypothetical protein